MDLEQIRRDFDEAEQNLANAEALFLQFCKTDGELNENDINIIYQYMQSCAKECDAALDARRLMAY